MADATETPRAVGTAGDLLPLLPGLPDTSPFVVHQGAAPVTALAAGALVTPPLGGPASTSARPLEASTSDLRACEVRFVTAGGRPLAGERCVLHVHYQLDGQSFEDVREVQADKDGVIQLWDKFTLLRGRSSFVEVASYLVLPDVLESTSNLGGPNLGLPPDWTPPPRGQNRSPQQPAYWTTVRGTQRPKGDDYRKVDPTIHPFAWTDTRQEIRVAQLTARQKLEYFIWSYLANGASYRTRTDNKPPLLEQPAAGQKKKVPRSPYWDWGAGAVCNEHVNFFLGYWFNYNEQFTTKGARTAMSAYPLYTSQVDQFQDPSNENGPLVPHRGYKEFLEPVIFRSAQPNRSAVPRASQLKFAYNCIPYTRMGQFFDRTTKALNDVGRQLVDQLGEVNVYSVSDSTGRKAAANNVIFVAQTRAWMKRHKDRFNLTDAQIDAADRNQLMATIWSLDSESAEDAELIAALGLWGNNDRQIDLEFDHHAGIILKLRTDGTPLRGDETADDVRLWKFSADSGRPIVLRELADAICNDYTEFTHYGLWKLKDLRPGGYAPVDADTSHNQGGIDLESPSRFIKWAR